MPALKAGRMRSATPASGYHAPDSGFRVSKSAWLPPSIRRDAHFATQLFWLRLLAARKQRKEIDQTATENQTNNRSADEHPGRHRSSGFANGVRRTATRRCETASGRPW